MMTTKYCSVFFTVLFAATCCHAAGVDFEPAVTGTTYGSGTGHSPGDIVYTQMGVDVSMETFFYYPAAAGSTFNSAEIVAGTNPFAPNATQALATNNINAMFHLPTPANYVAIEYIDLGGNENFDINGLGLQSVNDLTSVVAPPGFSVTVTPTGASTGRLEVMQTGAAPISSLLIGGQEFGVDNLRVVPEPGAGLIAFFAVAGLFGFRQPRRLARRIHPS